MIHALLWSVPYYLAKTPHDTDLIPSQPIMSKEWGGLVLFIKLIIKM